MEVFAYLSGRILLCIRVICGLLRHFGEAVAESVDDQFQTVGNFEFRKDGAEVVGYGGLTDK